MTTFRRPIVDQLLSALQSRIATTLGDQLIGLYLYGSLVAGDFDPDISDIDLLAITTADIDSPTFSRLRDMHAAIAADFPAWDNRIEVQYYSAGALRTFKTRRSPMVGLSPGEPINRKEAGTDWLLNWYFVQEYGRILYGPDPRTIIPPISTAEFLAASRSDAQYWRGWAAESHGQRAQSYAVLTLCRAIFAAETAERGSKPRSAHWVRTRYPQWTALIDHALLWRKSADEALNIGPDTWPETAAFVAFALDRIDCAA
jgi:predicted nucleotidyltransferase